MGDNNNNFTELKFQKLTPTSCDDMKSYEEALDFIFKENDLLNIAITGSYGAGKSSVIKTYEDNNKDKSYIHISLAYFEEIKDEKIENGENYNLEEKIINQFVHQIDPKKIPQTRFEIKKEVTENDVGKHTIIISILLILAIYILKYNKWIDVYSQLDYCFVKNMLWFTSNRYTYLAAIIINLSIIIFYLHKGITNQLYKPIIKKIKFQGNEIEIDEKSEKSYFDKHLDDIIYLFKNSNVDAVVFEDIDRYNNNKIFSKLREINSLVNKKTKDKPIRFIYLLRDDIFTSKDRTKFFDFILPIVPILDSSNSYDQLLKHFEDGGIIEQFEKSFLERISLYIDDMRILKSIYNEYIIYNSRIQCTELDSNKLLSIIIYKNIFPKDFADLQLNRGFVHNIFVNRYEFISELKRDIDRQIELNNHKIDKLKSEQLKEIDELDTLFLNFSKQLQVNGKEEGKFENRVEFIKEIKKNIQNTKYYYSNFSDSKYISYDIKSALEEMHKNPEYISRKKIIDEKLNNGIHNIEIENKKLNDKKRKLDSSKLKDLINKDNIDALFTMNIDLSKKQYSFILDSQYYPLIKYLIRNGHINETYFDYLTYFYENSLSRTDKVFLRSVTDEIAKEATYDLDDPEAVVSKLRKSDFEKEEILNYSLINYLVESKHEYLNILFMQIQKNKRFDFINNYVYSQTDNCVFRFIRNLNASWKELFKELIDYNTVIEEDDTVTEDHKHNYIINTFYVLHNEEDVQRLKEMNCDNVITEYIEKSVNFLKIESPFEKFITKGLKALNVHFKEINYDRSNKELFMVVYENNLYEINSKMISCILRNVYKLNNSSDYFRKSYSLISSNKSEELYKYINKNMNDYMSVILQECNENITDNEESIARILNDADIEIEYRKEYLSKLETSLTDIDKIEQEFWKDLLDANLIEYSIHNILGYYFKYSLDMDSTLIEFINRNDEELSFEIEEIKMSYIDHDVHKFYSNTISINKLNTSKYEMILKGFHEKYEEFEIKDIEKDKLEKLINLNIIEMSKHNIKFIRDNYNDSLMKFILKNIKQYIECLDEEILDKQEIIKIIVQPNVLDEDKISLLEKYPDGISLKDFDFSEQIKLYIIKNKYESDDLEYLIENFNEYSQLMKNEISEICIRNIEYICDNQLSISLELLDKIILNSDNNRDYKKELIYKNLEQLDIEKITTYMNNIGEHDLANLFNGCRPKILINDINEKILTYFYNKQWITNFDPDKKNSNYYRAIGKRIYEKDEK